MDWELFKEKYPRGTILELNVAKKVLPAFLFFKFTDQISGSLHISELNWNFGLCQEEFRSIRPDRPLQIYVKEFNDEHKKVILGRKILHVRPSASIIWEQLQLNEPIDATVYEEFKNKLTIKLASGLYGTLPLLPEMNCKLRDKIKVVPLSKDDRFEVVNCALAGFLETTKARDETVINDFEANLDESNYTNAEDVLTSFERFSASIYWKFMSNDEQLQLQASFLNNPNLFSRADAGLEPIYIEFPFEGYALDDLINHAGPVLFPPAEGEATPNKAELFILLSKEPFWYSQFFQDRVAANDDRFTSRNFSFFNNRLSIYGEILHNNRFRISSIKSSEHKDALRDRSKNLKNNDTILIKRPVIFFDTSINAPFQTYNPEFISRIQQKIHGRQLFERSLTATLDLLKAEGKDFGIFQDFLKNQISVETRQASNTEVELTHCKLSEKLQTEFIDFTGMLEDDHQFSIDEQVTITVKSLNAPPNFFTRGTITMIKGKEITITCMPIDFSTVEDGCYIKKVFSTRQHQVQLDVLEQFFANKLSLEVFYKIFYDQANIAAPENLDIQFFNQRLNDPGNPQHLAVKKAVGNQNILLIQGPPGTGKTTVITEVVKQLVRNKERVLVTSQTHVAVDNVLERIIEEKDIRIARLGQSEMISGFAAPYLLDQARKDFEKDIIGVVDLKLELVMQFLTAGPTDNLDMMATGDDDASAGWKKGQLRTFLNLLRSKSREELTNLLDTLQDWKKVITATPDLYNGLFVQNLDVVFGTCIGIATNRLLGGSDLMFDTVILDEAGKANISETLTAISKAKKVILVGDHKQLPPFIDSVSMGQFTQSSKRFRDGEINEEDVKKALGGSFFEYLQKDSVLPEQNKCMLAVQHRMHPDIGNFVSESFYDSKLANGPATTENILPLPAPFDQQILFIDTSSDKQPYETFYEGSYFNGLEANYIADFIIPELLNHQVAVEHMAIVSPYSLQCREISKLLRKKLPEQAALIEVATLDSFQGREYDVIIFSFTRSSPESRVGFLDDARRLNVAFSRAKKKLILIGNAETLCDPKSHFDRYYVRLFKRLKQYSARYGRFYRSNDLKQKPPKIGDEVQVTVVRVYDYGILVKFNANQGLIFNDQLLIFKEETLSEKYGLDAKFNAWVSGINPKGIVLTTISRRPKAPVRTPHQFEAFAKKYQLGDQLEGTITKVFPSSSNQRVIVEFTSGVEGMFYTTLQNRRIVIGASLPVRLTKIDHSKRSLTCQLVYERF